MDAVLSGIGIVPLVGDAIKGGGKLLKTGKSLSKVQREALQRAAREGGEKAAKRKAAELGLQSVRVLDDLPTAVKELRNVGRPLGESADTIRRGIKGGEREAKQLYKSLRGVRQNKFIENSPGGKYFSEDLPDSIHGIQMSPHPGKYEYTIRIERSDGFKDIKIRFDDGFPE